MFATKTNKGNTGSGSAYPVSPEKLCDLLPAASAVLLMLDYDGTLVPIVDKPDTARPDPQLLLLLENLAAKPGLIMAVISGRGTGDLEALLKTKQVIKVSCHGTRINWPDGRYEFTMPANARDGIRKLAALARQAMSSCDGILIEDKGTNLALHYRLAEQIVVEKVLFEFIKSVRHIIKSNDLEIMRGKKVLEIRPRGVNKGTAVKRLLREFPEAYPIYIGDDITDEDAFCALGDSGLSVLVADIDRTTAAHYRLSDSSEVRFFLSLLERRRGNSGCQA